MSNADYYLDELRFAPTLCLCARWPVARLLSSRAKPTSQATNNLLGAPATSGRADFNRAAGGSAPVVAWRAIVTRTPLTLSRPLYFEPLVSVALTTYYYVCVSASQLVASVAHKPDTSLIFSLFLFLKLILKGISRRMTTI